MRLYQSGKALKRFRRREWRCGICHEWVRWYDDLGVVGIVEHIIGHGIALHAARRTPHGFIRTGPPDPWCPCGHRFATLRELAEHMALHDEDYFCQFVILDALQEIDPDAH